MMERRGQVPRECSRSAPSGRAVPVPAAARHAGSPRGAAVRHAGPQAARVLAALGPPAAAAPGGLDAESYVSLARQVAQGDWILGGDPFFLSPLYIYFLGAVLAVSGGSLAVVRIAQAVLGTVAVWIVYRAGRRVLPHGPALTAAALAAATGLFTFHEALTIQSALDPFLTALAVWLVGDALAVPRGRRFLAAGLAVGLFVLNRPNALLYAAAVALLTVVRAPLRQGLARAGAFVLGLTLAIAPVTIRNVAASGDLVLISSHGGLNFYIGNHANADGTYRSIPGVRPSIAGQAEDARQVVEAALGHPARPSEVSSYFYDRAFEWIAREPGRALALFARKLAYTFSATDIALNYSFTYYSRDEPSWLKWLLVGPWCLLPLGLAGAGVVARGLGARPRADAHPRGADVALSWLVFIVAYALSVALFFVSGRYRLPLLVPLCLTSAAALAWIAHGIRARDWRGLTPLGLTVVLLAVLANWPLGLDDGRYHEREELILFLVDNRRDDEARVLLERTEPTHPDRARLLLRVGTALLERGDAAFAVPYLERSHGLAPGQVQVEAALGQALYGAGETALQAKQPAAALAFLDKAVAQNPQSATVREKRGLALAMLDRTAEGRAELEQAHALDPGNASICLNLAVLYAQEGRIDEARALAREALRLRPGYPQARGLLATLEEPR